MNEISKQYGAFIKQKRTNLGMTQEEVAKKLGISQQAYGRYEQGLREPNLKLMKQLAEVLQFRNGEFFDNY